MKIAIAKVLALRSEEMKANSHFPNFFRQYEYPDANSKFPKLRQVSSPAPQHTRHSPKYRLSETDKYAQKSDFTSSLVASAVVLSWGTAGVRGGTQYKPNQTKLIAPEC